MKLMVYKGFEYETLKQMPGHPLVNGDISEKKNVLAYTSKTRHRLQAKLLDFLPSREIISRRTIDDRHPL